MEKFTWFNLPKKIKEELGENVKWYNLPNELNNLYKRLKEEYGECNDIPYIKFIWFNLPKKVDILKSIYDSLEECVTPEPELFEITLFLSLTLGCEEELFNIENTISAFTNNSDPQALNIGDTIELAEGEPINDGIYYVLEAEKYINILDGLIVLLPEC